MERLERVKKTKSTNKREIWGISRRKKKNWKFLGCGVDRTNLIF
jgi:hypothetical protein